MSITLDELAGKNNNVAATPSSNGLKKVNISDITSNMGEDPNANASPSFVAEQFGALDGLINQANAKREAYIDSHQDERIDEALEEFDPTEDDGPIAVTSSVDNSSNQIPSVHVADIERIQEPLPETPSYDTADIDLTKNNQIIEKPNPKAEEDKRIEQEEKEFNSIFANDDDDDKELLDIINDNDSDETIEDDEDVQDESENEISEEERKELLDNYRKEVTDVFAKRNTIDTTGFTVSNKAISISKLLNIKEPDKKIADWVQVTSKKPFSTIEYSGFELQKINPNARSRNSINTKKENYRSIYNHIVGVSKDGFENWLKTTPYSDVAHFYFGAYKATFGDYNIVTHQCTNPKCNNIFVLEHPIEDMYEIDEASKEEFERIYNGDTSSPVEFTEEIIPVSPQFAIGWIEPSIYSVEIEPLLIDKETQDKYARVIGLLPFIKQMYYIDNEHKTYVPIDEAPVPKDMAKTVKKKLAVYYNVLNSLTNDQLAVPQLRAYNYTEKTDYVKFIEPECNCPKCGKVVPKQETSAITLLFSRAQSPLAANS